MPEFYDPQQMNGWSCRLVILRLQVRLRLRQEKHFQTPCFVVDWLALSILLSSSPLLFK